MKYLISGDYHLDENKRFEDYLRNMNELELASSIHTPDVFVHCGDVFNKRHPTPKELREFALHLTRIQSKKILIVKGNHDTIDEYLSTLDWIQTNKVEVKNIFRVKDEKYSMYIAHRTVTEAKLGPKEVHLKDISYKKLPGDIIILGHIHKPQIINGSNPLVFYPGSIERINFGELNEDKYYWVMNIDKSKITLKKYPFKLRPMYQLIYYLDKNYFTVNDIAESNYEIKGAILKVKFIGKKSTIRKINYDKLTNKYKGAYSVDYQFEYSDETPLIKTSKIKEVSDKDILKSYCDEYKINEVVRKVAEKIIGE